MARTTRKMFLRQSTADSLKTVLHELARARDCVRDADKALQVLEGAAAKLQSALKLAQSQPPGYRPMPASIRQRLRTLETKTQETLEMVRHWAITPEEKTLKKAGKRR